MNKDEQPACLRMIMGIKARWDLDLLLMSAIIQSLPIMFFNRLDTFLICLPLPNPALCSK